MLVNETDLRKKAFDELFGKPQEAAEGSWITNYSLVLAAIIFVLFEKGIF
ncbi:hypothetical protein [Bacillus sp. SG-1]|nr:hypothetical protein [Bacillus sp. SG-1]EDL64289.1 hypothetical protein BSG1_06177 [Bacillus sp. SG-1]